MRVLLTGGCGYIGSHIASLLLPEHEVVIIDIKSKEIITELEKIGKVKFHLIDMNDPFDIPEIPDIVIHLAGLKAVGESVEQPLLYYENNLKSTFNLLRFMEKNKVKNLIFSSSATVYGDSLPPLNEESKTGINITNPYGKTKYFIEEILKDYQYANPDMNITILRYFNPIGCHPILNLQENTKNRPNNLIPVIMSRLQNGNKLQVYGNDYPTPDKTAIRDYIHIMDLARAHILAMNNKKLVIKNVGTGKGTSVLEILNIFEDNGCKIDWEFAPRRPGDLPEVYCEVNEFKCEFTVEDAIRGILDKN